MSKRGGQNKTAEVLCLTPDKKKGGGGIDLAEKKRKYMQELLRGSLPFGREGRRIDKDQNECKGRSTGDTGLEAGGDANCKQV